MLKSIECFMYFGISILFRYHYVHSYLKTLVPPLYTYILNLYTPLSIGNTICDQICKNPTCSDIFLPLSTYIAKGMVSQSLAENFRNYSS